MTNANQLGDICTEASVGGESVCIEICAEEMRRMWGGNNLREI